MLGVSTRSSLTAYFTSTLPFIIRRRTLYHRVQHKLTTFRFRGQHRRVNRQVHPASDRSAVKSAWLILACFLFYDIPNTDHQKLRGLQPTHRFLYTNTGRNLVDKAFILFCPSYVLQRRYIPQQIQSKMFFSPFVNRRPSSLVSMNT